MMTLKAIAHGGILLGLALMLVAPAPAASQTPPAATASAPAAQAAVNGNKASHAGAPVDCTICHSCPSPSPFNPCLKECPRPGGLTSRAPGEKIPDIVVIGQLANLFAPTRFNHKAHSEMAAMGGGCQSCHHNVAPGQEHIACRECHIDGINMENLAQPGLRGVYHRMCMKCHSDWNEDTKCQNCHARKGEPESEAQAAVKDHPPTTITNLITFDTKFKPDDKVPFHHQRHTEVYGFDCQMCHKNEGCLTCHSAGKKAAEAVHQMGNGEPHGKCFQCHATNKCDHCHGRAENDLFTHPELKSLKKEVFATMSCRNCHGHGGPYSMIPKQPGQQDGESGGAAPAPAAPQSPGAP